MVQIDQDEFVTAWAVFWLHTYHQVVGDTICQRGQCSGMKTEYVEDLLGIASMAANVCLHRIDMTSYLFTSRVTSPKMQRGLYGV